ncbi:glycosyltransferase family A protein [Vibrio breoganii]
MKDKCYAISVIIPHYNSSISLKRLLESIPVREEIEVVVVDDYSSSLQFEKVKSLFVNRKHAILHKNSNKKGAGVCRNIGIEYSSGGHLLFADADDFFTKEAFDILLKMTVSNPKTDIVFFPPTSCYDEDTRVKARRHLKYKNMLEEFTYNASKKNELKLRLTHNVPWSKLIDASLVKNNCLRFDDTIVANDGMFSLKVGKLANSIAVSNEIIYVSTVTKNSLTTKKSYDNYKVRLEVFVRYYNFLTEEERKIIEVTPLPMLSLSRFYGLKAIYESFVFIKNNNIPIFKYFNLKNYFHLLNK